MCASQSPTRILLVEDERIIAMATSQELASRGFAVDVAHDAESGITRYGYVLKNSGPFVLTQSIEIALELFRAHQTLEATVATRMATERRLAESEAKYRLIVQHSDEAITLFDTEGNVRVMNEKAARNLNGVPDDFHGRNIRDFLPEAEAARACETIRRVSSTGKTSDDEWMVPIPGGNRWFRSRVIPIASEGPECVDQPGPSRVFFAVHRD